MYEVCLPAVLGCSVADAVAANAGSHGAPIEPAPSGTGNAYDVTAWEEKKKKKRHV